MSLGGKSTTRRPSFWGPSLGLIGVLVAVGCLWQQPASTEGAGRARSVILFVGDGMGVSTVTAARIFASGADGQLHMDRFPYTAMSLTYTADHITPDSAGTATAMLTGVNANQGIIGFGPETERQDFNSDGDGDPLVTLAEQAKAAGMLVGIVTNTRATHATPASCFAHINEREDENAIALQALPSDPTYNKRLGNGIDLWFGGGRRHFLPIEVIDEEGELGTRTDKRDLRSEFQKAGYKYIWNSTQFAKLTVADLPILGLFDSTHMEYEADRPSDKGGEPSVAEMTARAIAILEEKTRGSDRGYFLLVEGGRIDHAHHAGNAYRALVDTCEFDQAIGETVASVDESSTLVIVTADHSHVFNIAGYPLRPPTKLPYKPKSTPKAYEESPQHLLDIVYGINPKTGKVVPVKDETGVPYTVLQYGNGPGARLRGSRLDPRRDPFPGYAGKTGGNPTDPWYRQEATVRLASETHSAEDVVIYGWGVGAELVRGTVKNTHVYHVMRTALGFEEANPTK